MLKKMTAVLICSCIFILMTPAAAFAEEPAIEDKIGQYTRGGYIGDIDRNNKVEVGDARRVLRVAVKLDTFSEEQETDADVDFDGAVTVADARSILRYAVGLSGFVLPFTEQEIIEYFVNAANNVKTEKPGLDRKTTTVSPSIKMSVTGTEVQDMELYDTKAYIDEQIELLEKYRDIWEIILPQNEIDKLNEKISQWKENRDGIDEQYKPQVETFHVAAGNSHYAAFTVRGKSWSSKAAAEDVKSAKLMFMKGLLYIDIAYGEEYYTQLPADITTIKYGKMFDVPSSATFNKPSRTDYKLNALSLKNGAVNCRIDIQTGAIKEVKYFYEYIWDYTVTGKSEIDNSDTQSRSVHTVRNTAEYVIAEKVENPV